MRVGLRTGIRRLRTLMKILSGEENVLHVREIASANSETSFQACFGFKLFCITNM
jgi:hypothetical protein